MGVAGDREVLERDDERAVGLVKQGDRASGGAVDGVERARAHRAAALGMALCSAIADAEGVALCSTIADAAGDGGVGGSRALVCPPT